MDELFVFFYDELKFTYTKMLESRTIVINRRGKIKNK